VHAGGLTIQEFHIPVTITESASYVQVSFEARDINTGALIPFANLNLTVASSGANTAYDLGITGKRYLQLQRNEFYKFNITKGPNYLYPTIPSGTGTTLWYSLYTGTFEGQDLIETVTYLTPVSSFPTNKTGLTFKVTDAITTWDVPGAWIEVRNQSGTLLYWGETQDLGGKTFTVGTNQTYVWEVSKGTAAPGPYLSATGSVIVYALPQTVTVQLYPITETTLPPGVTTPVTATPDYQHDETARGDAIWGGLSLFYSNAALIFSLAFIVFILTLLGYMGEAVGRFSRAFGGGGGRRRR
jgi:hypothetical protein